MPAYSLCQKFFRGTLAPFHQYRQNALLDATVALTRGASLTLTSIGRYLPGAAQIKNKIKRVDRLLGNSALNRDIPLIFRNITSLLTHNLPWCVIAVDWSGYPSQEYHVLRASLLCDGRSIPQMSHIVPSKKQNNSLAQKAFLNDLAAAIPAGRRVTIVTDAGFRCSWFHQVRELGWNFVGRVRGTVYFRLNNDEQWRQLKDLSFKPSTEYLGDGVLARSEDVRCDGHFYLHKKSVKGRKNKHSKRRPNKPTTEKEQRAAAKEPWLIFTSTNSFKDKEVIKLYSRRMQIEQNFRDEKSERFGFGLRASRSKTGPRLAVLCLLATLSTIVLWLMGYHIEKKDYIYDIRQIAQSIGVLFPI